GSYQASLFGLDDPSWPALEPHRLQRTWLDDECWVDLVPRWLRGADLVFGELVARLNWGQREVVMYDRLLPEPRLTWWWTTASSKAEPLPVLRDIRHDLSRHYDRWFDCIGCNLYRDGNDSVAWHGDRERFVREDPVVAIVSVGSARPFQMRPRPGGPSRSWLLGHGDLFVMGGACQHDWMHCVPKVAHAPGPRLSIMFRHDQAEERLDRLRD
ncbi:MAG: alpha-ketoglutarate-dependent dioxygenase AlkB, partial [Ilumatobacteraceae bacterium]